MKHWPSPPAKGEMFFVVIAALAVAVSSQSNELPSSSWAQLQISPSGLCSMPYGNFRINIYEHTNNQKASTFQSSKKYFYAPIALLDHKSAVTPFNNVTNQPQVRFRIEIWNDKVEAQVVKYLTEFVGQPIQPNQVQVIPFEKLILASPSPSTVFSLPSDWMPYQLLKSLQFTLTCSLQEDCDQLAADMRTSPQQFDHFKLLFSLTSHTSQTRETVIRIDNIVSGQMASHLLQRFDPNVKEAFLTAQDEKQLLMETVTNIIVETFDDSDMISPNSESQVYNILKDLLISSRTIIKDQTDTMWDSVFWNEDNYRPDKTTKTLNDIYKKLDTESQKTFSQTYSNTNKESGSAQVSGKVKFMKIAGSANYNKEFSSHGGTTNEDMEKFYQESKDHVEWDGEKFSPKPMSLSRINLSKLRDTQSFQDRKVSVRYSTAVLTTPINFVQNADLTVTDEWQILKDELKETKKNVEYKLNETNRNVEILKSELNERTSAIDIGRMPTSCADLQRIGNKRNGFFSIMGQNKIQTVHCNFAKQQNDTDFQSFIGYVDVKSSPVYFYGQRTTSFTTVNAVIPFDRIRLNVGNALNSNGVFVAPKSGKYFFSFSTISNFNVVGRVDLQMKSATSDWFKIAQAYGQTTYGTLTLQSTLQLTKGDQIRLILTEGAIIESGSGCCGPYANFVGWVLEEDLF